MPKVNAMQSDGRDPWKGKNSSNQPPDLDEVFGKMLGFISKLLGSGSGGSSNSGNTGDEGGNSGGQTGRVPSKKHKSLYIIIGSVAVLGWLFSGFYIVSEGTRGVELRFSAYQDTTAPGPHWHLPYPMETVEKVDIDSIRSVQNKAQMLTQDENIVEVEVAVQYRVSNAPDYLFNVRLPDAPPGVRGVSVSEGAVFQVMESALRDVVGKAKMDYLLGAGRAEVAASTKSLIQQILDGYKSGIEIINVNLQQSQPPAAVQDAFADAIKAREDEVRYVNEAETYSNGIIPKARGEKARMLEDANAYREKIVANAKGDASRFMQLYAEYKKAPEVTRKRLYLQAVENFLEGTRKVIMNVDNSNSLFYLPLDQILKQNPLNNDAAAGDAEDASGRGMPTPGFDNARGPRRGKR